MNKESYYQFSHQQEPWVLDDGRLITDDGEELFTVYLLPTVGRLVLTRDFNPNMSAATPVIRRQGQSHLGSDNTEYVSRRPAKARSALLRYHIHNRLSIAGTLTLGDWDEGVVLPLRRFIERLRYARGDVFPWTAVAEIGAKGNPHWHVCLPDCFSIEELHDQWGVFNISEFETILNDKSLLKWTRYMSKRFSLGLSERLTYRRFHCGPGFRPQAIKIERITRSNAHRLAQELSNDVGSEVVEWTGTDAWCPVGYFWHT